jgi:hypothetical protein
MVMYIPHEELKVIGFQNTQSGHAIKNFCGKGKKYTRNFKVIMLR